MEVRTVRQIKVYKLQLNPVTGSAEDFRVAAVSTDYDKLVEWYRNLEVEPYQDKDPDDMHCYCKYFWKHFRKCSSLEYYNPLSTTATPVNSNCGIFAEWINEDTFHEIMVPDRIACTIVCMS